MNPYWMILDSGAVSLYNIHGKKNAKTNMGASFKDRKFSDYSYFTSDEFLEYRDAYIAYVKKNHKHISAYVNLDVINNAEESYKSLKYMEKRGCTPLPVYHLGNDVKWLERYIKEGYKFICIGGITPNTFSAVKPILDRIWRDILTDSDGMPIVKVHGLAATGYRVLKRYPWWSADSTSWRKLAAYGKILIPRRRADGTFRFDREPWTIGASFISPTRKDRNRHLLSMSGRFKENMMAWINHIGLPLGAVDPKTEEMTEWGVISHHNARGELNMRYYVELAKSIPQWPWAFKIPKRKGLLE